jgi:GGDEF domain-containing protein
MDQRRPRSRLWPGPLSNGGAPQVAEEIRAALLGRKPVLSGMRVTASIGVAVFPMHGSTLDDVIRVADMARYQAKSSGRDERCRHQHERSLVRRAPTALSRISAL